MQKAIIVADNNLGKERLNQLLEDGWKVVQMCPMTSSAATNSIDYSHSPTCLVIVEKLHNIKDVCPW